MYKLIIPLIILNTNLYASDTLKNINTKKFFGLQFGINSTSLGSTNSFKPSIYTNSISYEGGIAFDIIRKRFYSQRLGFLYKQMLINDLFLTSNKKVNSQIVFNNLHTYYYPIILKLRSKNTFSPYLAVGGYGSYTIKFKSQYKINDGSFREDKYLIKYVANQPYDYGIKASLGLYLFQNPIELYIEKGVKKVLPNSTNTSIAFCISLL